MSITVLPPASGDFDRWESELDPKVPPFRTPRAGRGTEKREAIDESAGKRRYRTHERKA